MITKDNPTVKNVIKFEKELLKNRSVDETDKFYQLTSVGSGAL